ARHPHRAPARRHPAARPRRPHPLRRKQAARRRAARHQPLHPLPHVGRQLRLQRIPRRLAIKKSFSQPRYTRCRRLSAPRVRSRMKNLCIVLLLCASAAYPLHAQLRAAPAPTPAAVPAQNLNQDIAARSRDLSRLFDEIWQDKLRHSPEYATTLGDNRYDDQLTDFSPRAYNESLARGRAFIERLAAIDTTGLPHQEQLSAELMLRSLSDDQEAALYKEWEMPVNQYEGLQLDLPQLAAHTSFDTSDDYDHYIARLAKVPVAFSQIMTNLQSGLDDHRTPPQFLMQKALAETQSIAAQKPADSPFAQPLKNFPKSVGPEDRKRITEAVFDAIANKVLPSYQRFAKFLAVAYIPNCRTDPGISALPDGAAYYAFRIRQSTTLNKSAAEIHQIGLAEVARDQAEMLAIVHKL